MSFNWSANTEPQQGAAASPQVLWPGCFQRYDSLMALARILVLALSLTLGWNSAQAQDTKLTKAGEVVDAMLEIDGQEQAKLAVEDMLRQTREYEFRAEYEAFFIGLGQSPEFRSAKARAYADAFSEQELEEVLALAKNPAFRKLQERSPTLMRASRTAFSETLRPKIMEFAHRIEALKQARQRR
jgi:hypothetical protein